MEGPLHPLLPQPDFHAVATEHRALATNHELLAVQFERFTGIPALNQGQQLVNMLHNLENKIDNLTQGVSNIQEQARHMTARLDGIDTRLDGIDARLDGIDARLDGIDTRLDGIDARLDRMDARFNGIDARFDSMEQGIKTHIAASENNSIARMRNARADRADSRLVPLYAVATNVEIEDFPKTLGDIDKLELATLNNIYTLLGHPRPGNIRNKRRDLKKLAGVFHQDLHDHLPPQPSRN